MMKWLLTFCILSFLASCTPSRLDLGAGQTDEPSQQLQQLEEPSTPTPTPTPTPEEEPPQPTATPEPVEPEPTATPPKDVTSFTHGVMKQSQILRSFSKCLGLKNNELSATTLETYSQIRANLPKHGRAKEISAPFFMSALQLVGEICNDLIRKEQTQRRFFSGLTLNGNSDSAEFSVEQTVTQLASACWGRAPLESETQLLADGFDQSGISQVRNEKAALFICASTLATAEAVRY